MSSLVHKLYTPMMGSMIVVKIETVFSSWRWCRWRGKSSIVIVYVDHINDEIFFIVRWLSGMSALSIVNDFDGFLKGFIFVMLSIEEKKEVINTLWYYSIISLNDSLFSKKFNVSSFKDHQRYGLGLKITEIQSFKGCIHLWHWFQCTKQFLTIDNLINYSSNWLQFGQLFNCYPTSWIIFVFNAFVCNAKFHFFFWYPIDSNEIQSVTKLECFIQM